MKILHFFKPAPHIKGIQGKSVINKQYFYWRLRIFYSMYIGYAFYYFSRKSFTFVMPLMIQELHYSKASLGFLASLFAIFYGFSKFVSGVISDKSNPRYFMAFGLIMTGIFNVLFGLSSTIFFFSIFWCLNGWFQGFGWPPSAKLLTHWFSQSERGRWWSIWNTSHNLGGAIIPIIISLIIAKFGWRAGMWLPGFVCIFVGLFIINRLRDTPQSLGLPAIEIFKKEKIEAKLSDIKKLQLSAKVILIEYVFKNKYVWFMGTAYFFIYIIRTAVNDWIALFFIESKNYSLLAAGTTVFLFEMGGFVGSLLAGWSSDYFFKSKRGPINILFSLGVFLSTFALWKYSCSPVMDSVLLFLIGLFVFGPQLMIGIAVAELSHKKAAGSSTGFIGIFAYIGVFIAGWPLGALIQNYGWGYFFCFLSISAIIAFVLLVPFWNSKFNTKHIKV